MRGDRLHHRVGVVHLDADHLDLGPHGLDVVGHAGDEAAAADRHEHRVERALVLAQDFHRDGALARDDIGIVEGMNEGQVLLRLQFERMQVGIGIAVAMQHDLAAETTHCIDLQLRRGHGHHDHRARAELARAERNALRVIAGRCANHTARQLRFAQVRHLVIGTAQFETEYGLLVLALEQHGIAEPLAERARLLQRRLDGHVVDPRIEDFSEIVGGR
ncbi:hypothetical protein D9M69_556630 [compost metagenome]